MEFASGDEELAADLEGAGDNAIIRIALAKLNARQLEVMVASVYEEKSTDEIADELNLSSNAKKAAILPSAE